MVLNENGMKGATKFVAAGVVAVLIGKFVTPMVSGVTKNAYLTAGVMILVGAFMLGMGHGVLRILGGGLVIAGIFGAASAAGFA